MSDSIDPWRQLVGSFIDAAVNERAKALSLLAVHPQLRDATWLGEPLVQFLAVEGYADAVEFLVRSGFAVEGLANAVSDVVMLGNGPMLELLISLGARLDSTSVNDLEGIVNMLCPDGAARKRVLDVLRAHHPN